VLRTRVGYAGGKKDKPTYYDLGDHTEAVQVEFDPKVVRFEDLLKIFWAEHDECGRVWSDQYKAVLWTHGKEQARIAQASAALQAKERGKELTTGILPAPVFWIAEDYHQKYNARRHGKLLSALLGEKHTETAVRESTAIARVNGWVSGHGSKDEIAAEVERLRFPVEARKELTRVLGRRAPTALLPGR
jgi:peptide-methionine (S)-S-oxide reductase